MKILKKKYERKIFENLSFLPEVDPEKQRQFYKEEKVR